MIPAALVAVVLFSTSEAAMTHALKYTDAATLTGRLLCSLPLSALLFIALQAFRTVLGQRRADSLHWKRAFRWVLNVSFMAAAIQLGEVLQPYMRLFFLHPIWTGISTKPITNPVKFLHGDDVVKRWSIYDVPPEVLITGRYQFGSNELSIFRALAKVADMIERDHGVRLSDIKPKA